MEIFTLPSDCMVVNVSRKARDQFSSPSDVRIKRVKVVSELLRNPLS